MIINDVLCLWLLVLSLSLLSYRGFLVLNILVVVGFSFGIMMNQVP